MEHLETITPHSGDIVVIVGTVKGLVQRSVDLLDGVS